MDGLVSNASLVAGVGGAGASGHTVLLTGLAGLVAGAFSMAAGEYTSVRAQREATFAQVAMEKLELRRSPRSEHAELSLAYQERGLERQLADEVARQLMRQPDTALRVHTQEELGVDIDRLPSPWVAAGSSLLAFALGAFVPVLPYAVGARWLWLALLLAAVALFGAGALATRLTARNAWYAGTRQLLMGAAAAAVTYGVGSAVGAGVS
jgi:VIT1/CCC1 family predicted Fe2+/Mn2+ transporter